MSNAGTGLRIPSLLLAAMLASCGGGGGGGGTSDGGGTSPTSTGLIPAAPEVGATLVADGTTLRPLVAGGKWTYRGVGEVINESTQQSVAGVTLYSNDVSQSSASLGGFDEVASNTDNAGSAQQRVYTLAGAVRNASLADIGTGTSVTIDAIELGAVIRVNDQQTVLDRRVSAGTDLDGDGVLDDLDIAVYTRVIGQENVDLISAPNLPTIKIQTVAITRARYSKTGSFSDTLSATQTNWYAPGVGLVKHQSDTPHSQAGFRSRNTESLLRWNGVTRGLGAMESVVVGASSGGSLNYYTTGAIGFDDHALLMRYAGTLPTDGTSLVSVDVNGAILAQHTYPSLENSRGRLYRVQDGARLVYAADDGIYMYFFDKHGAATGAAPVKLHDITANPYPDLVDTYAGASDAVSIWLGWIAFSVPGDNSTSKLELTHFDANGVQLAPSVVLPTSFLGLGRPDSISAAAGDGHAVFSWNYFDDKHYAVIDANNGVSTHSFVASNFNSFRLTPIASDSGAGLLWSLQTDAETNRLFGVSFDAFGQPLRSNALGIETELINASWLPSVNDKTFLYAPGRTSNSQNKTDVYEESYLTLYPNDVSPSSVKSITEIDLSGGALATSTKVRVLARGGYDFPLATWMVSLPDRVLVFTDSATDSSTTGLKMTMVWRRP